MIESLDSLHALHSLTSISKTHQLKIRKIRKSSEPNIHLGWGFPCSFSKNDTFDTFSHPCLLPSCSGVASKTLRTHLRLSTLATPALRQLSDWAKWPRHTKKMVEQDMSSHTYFPTKNGTYIYIWYVYIYIYIWYHRFRWPLQTTYIFLSKNQDDLQMHGTSHRSQGMSPSQWWDRSTNVHGQKHLASPPRRVKLGESSKILKPPTCPKLPGNNLETNTMH